MKVSETTAAAVMRSAFDQSFAAPRSPPLRATEDALGLRVGSTPCVVRLAEVAGLHVDREVVPVPSGRRDFHGLVGLRGAVIPVYDLRVLLGQAADRPPRWLLQARAASVCFAFDLFDRYLSLGAQALQPEKLAGGSPWIQGVVLGPDGARSLLGLGSLVEFIRAEVARMGEARR